MKTHRAFFESSTAITPTQIQAKEIQEESPISIVPNDLLIEFFSYFEDRSEHVGFELVCQRWKAIATNNEILRPLLEARNVILPTRPVPQGYLYQFELFSRRASRLFRDYSNQKLFKEIRHRLNPTPMLTFLKSNEEFLSNLHLLIMYPFANFTSEDVLQSCKYISKHCPNLEVVDLKCCYNIDPRVKIVSITWFKMNCPNIPNILLDKTPEPAVQQVYEHFLPVKKRPEMYL